MVKNKVILLHAFLKKSDQIPEYALILL